MTLTPADAFSGMTGGLAATTWELDGGATQTGTSVLVEAPSDHSGDGARTITYRSTDAAGNREPDRTATVLVDTLAPTTRDDLAAGPPAHTDPVTVTLHASDEHGSLDVSGVAVTHYRVDDGPWQTGTSVEVTGDGEHTVSYYSTDNAGNEEARQDVDYGDDRHDAARRQQRRRSCRLGEPSGDRDAHAGRAGAEHHLGARRRRHPDGHQRRRGGAGRSQRRRRAHRHLSLVGLRRRRRADAHGRRPHRHPGAADE